MERHRRAPRAAAPRPFTGRFSIPPELLPAARGVRRARRRLAPRSAAAPSNGRPKTPGPVQNFPSSQPVDGAHRPARRGSPRPSSRQHLPRSPGARAARRRVRRTARTAARFAARPRHADRRSFESFAAFAAGDAALGITVSAAVTGMRLECAAARNTDRIATVRRPRPPGAPAPPRRARSGEDTQGAVRSARRRAGGARDLRRRALSSACRPWRSRATPASSSCSNMPTATSCTCRCRRCTSCRATPARRPKRRRCTSSAAISGRRRAARPRSAYATSPRSSSTCTRGGPRAKARVSCGRRRPTTARSRRRSRFEETADQASAQSTRCSPT